MFLYTLLCWLSLRGQVDTVRLDPMEFEGFAFVPYATGQVVRTLSENGVLETLDQRLSSEGLYLKTYGNAQLATISFRGTSAAHTNVLWHGIPVNSPTLGLTDFSQWHSWLIDQVAVQAGNEGALYGTGSIGGTVFIDHFNTKRANEVMLGLEFGSFGYNFQGVQAGFKKNDFQGTTKFYRSAIANNFTYPLKGTDVMQTQQNAAVLNYGFRQEVQRFWQNQRLSVDGLFFYQHRESQPSTTQNSGADFIITENYKLAFEHLINLNQASFTTTLGFMADQMTYNVMPPIATQQLSLTSRYDRSFSKSLHWIAGFLYNTSKAEGPNFQIDGAQRQLDFFSIFNYKINKVWSSTIGFRESNVVGKGLQWLPSLGIKSQWTLAERSWGFFGKLAKGFRYPTLNDRFWSPGGNNLLLPEKSISTDFGVQLSQGVVGSSLTMYQTWSEDWILWMPQAQSIWQPQNIQKVTISGIEYSLSSQLEITQLLIKSEWLLSVQKSKNVSPYPSQLQLGNQLPYVPYLSSIWANTFSFRRYTLTVDQSYTGRRFTTLDNDNKYSVASFYLLDISMASSLDFQKIAFDLSFKVGNVLNDYYENIKNRAMPGVNFQFQITTKL